ncbi:MAG: GMC family oxidoreductase [Nocardia sp.]|nr:GMC family oxidoreductase [Nocardia sp.]
MSRSQDVDWVVIGSGFGGSVAALRLAEKGYSVTVLEQGRRFADEDFAKNASNVRRFMWAPRLGMKGIMALTPFKHVTVLSGVGVGGGSLVYGNTLYVPRSDDFYQHEQWAGLADWRSVLAPHYVTAERMLGVVPFQGDTPSDALMGKIAGDLGVDPPHPTQVGVFFGMPGKRVPDPYFDGRGPERTGCTRCGQCMLGCRVGAKNTLTKNYLWLAEHHGADVRAERTVVDIWPVGAADGSDGYDVTTVRSGAWVRRDVRTIRAKGVVVAAGALGTNLLLRKVKDAGSLPAVSERLGHLVRTNSEAIVAVTGEKSADLRSDIAITSSIHPDEQTHFTNNTYGLAGDAMALTFGPLTSGNSRSGRIIGLLVAMLRRPLRWLSPGRVVGWSKRSVVFTIMQSTESSIRIRPKRPGGRVNSELGDGPAPLSKLPIADRIVASAVKHTGGYAQAGVTEAVRGTPTTAHILGGAVIADSPERGVVDRRRQVFGYRNLLITDGSTVPANVGVNPSLTITAMAEEAMTFVPSKIESEQR